MTNQTIVVPDIGSTDAVKVIEVLVGVGDRIEQEASLVLLESDKATMEIPSPYAGEVIAVHTQVGADVSEGSLILDIKVQDAVAAAQTAPAAAPSQPAPGADSLVASTTSAIVPSSPPSTAVHAGPGVRRLARELGVDLAALSPTGQKGRVTKHDLHQHIKQRMQSGDGSSSLPSLPEVDFSQFGPIEVQPLSRINKLTAKHMQACWLNVPQVTQFGNADITELEAFRKAQKEAAATQGVRLTLLAFLLKAVVAGLRAHPRFNSSLDPSQTQLICKQYYHIGVAIDTAAGLVVGVIRDVEQKGVLVLAKELGEISAKARDKGLSPQEMQGGCFTISSLGGIGGTAFTPIVNAPDVGILGVAKAQLQPVYNAAGEVVPRLQLPLALSYDHRVIDGAEGARFITTVANALSDIRTLLL